MKTLTYVDGNLLTIGGINYIGHQANCQNTFGAGIARTIREMYPEAYAADTTAHRLKANTLGQISVATIACSNGVNRYGNRIERIYNLYGQNLGTNHSATMRPRNTNYEALFNALERMRKDVDLLNIGTVSPAVGFPYLMGSALGGGNWNIVSRLIEVAFDGYAGNVYIVKFNG